MFLRHGGHGRVFAGGYIFGAVGILQLHAQAFGIGVPSQFLSMLPYAVTIVVLIIISHNRRTTLINTPASLGKPFVPIVDMASEQRSFTPNRGRI